MTRQDQRLVRSILVPAFVLGFLLVTAVAVALGVPWDTAGVGASR